MQIKSKNVKSHSNRFFKLDIVTDFVQHHGRACVRGSFKDKPYFKHVQAPCPYLQWRAKLIRVQLATERTSETIPPMNFLAHPDWPIGRKDWVVSLTILRPNPSTRKLIIYIIALFESYNDPRAFKVGTDFIGTIPNLNVKKYFRYPPYLGGLP